MKKWDTILWVMSLWKSTLWVTEWEGGLADGCQIRFLTNEERLPSSINQKPRYPTYRGALGARVAVAGTSIH